MKRLLSSLLLANVIAVSVANAGGLLLRQSTSATVMVGPYLDSTDGNTQETALTIANTDVVLSKNGGAFAAKNSGGCTHDSKGYYACTLNATDTSTVGTLQLASHPAGALAVYQEFQVVEEAVYDADLAASATGLRAADVTRFNGSAATSSGGRPEVNASHWGGSAVATARPLVDTVLISGDATAADRLEAILDGTCGAYPELGISRGVGCTAQAYTAGTPSITLDTGAAFGDNTLRGHIIMICGSTQGYCQPAVAASNGGSSDIVTLEQALPVTPTGTITFTIYAVPASSGVDVKKINGSSVCGTGASGDLWAKCP